MKKHILLFSILLTGAARLYAQLPGACGSGFLPATACEDACILCNFNGYSGSTTGFPSGPAVDFCGTVENVQWVGFIAGATTATFTITPSNCSDGNGVQVALYADCMSAPMACDKGEADGGNLPVSITATLIPGYNYFLLIDGYAGDQCDFTIAVDPPEAVYEPPLGVVGAVSGPTKLCPGGSGQFYIQEVFGASAYIWDGPPGTLVNGDSVPVTVAGKAGTLVTVTIGNQPGAICVQAANSCEVNPPCTGSLNVELLDDSYRPQLEADTTDHLPCSGAPLRLRPDITPEQGNYLFAWTADSSGHIRTDTSLWFVEVDKTGRYTFRVTDLNNGCSSELNIGVAEPDTPRVGRWTLRHATCYGYRDGALHVDSMAGGQEPFLFSLGEEGLLGPSPDFRLLQAGDYTLFVEDSDGCAWDTTFQITQPDELLVTLDPDTTVLLGEPLELLRDRMLSDPDRVVQRLSNPADFTPMLCDTCMYKPLHSFKYAVTVLDSNGCKGADERTVLVDQTRRVFIPNAFRPEGGNGNESFRIYGGDDLERVAVFRIFNQWGNLVHERYDFYPDDAASWWNGTYRGDKVGPGVFVYQVEVLFRDGEKEVLRGDVLVVR